MVPDLVSWYITSYIYLRLTHIIMSTADVPMEDAVPAADVDVETESNDNENDNIDLEKIQLLPGSSDDGTSASFQIIDEDHTLGNALRYIIMKNPDVEFCGYSIPHPSEAKLNIRIQTYGASTAVEALHKGLDDLVDLCSHVEDTFSEKVSSRNYSTTEP